MAIDLAATLQQHDYSMRFCTIEEPGSLSSELERFAIPKTSLHKPPGLRTSYALALKREIESAGADLVHSHNETAIFYSAIALAMKMRRIPHIHTRHGMSSSGSRMAGLRNRISSKFVDRYVAVSDNVYRHALTNEGVAERSASKILNGVKLDPFITAGEKRAETTEFTFGHVGRLAPEKNQEMLIRAFADVAAVREHSRLVIAGDGEVGARLRLLASELDVADKIDFVGVCLDVPSVLERVDCFVLSSITEGTPLAVIEAMASGCPIISTAVGEMPNIVRHGQNGFLVKLGNIEEMTSTMLMCVDNPNRVQEMGKIAKADSIASFDIDAMAGQYARLYKELLRAPDR